MVRGMRSPTAASGSMIYRVSISTATSSSPLRHPTLQQSNVSKLPHGLIHVSQIGRHLLDDSLANDGGRGLGQPTSITRQAISILSDLFVIRIKNCTGIGTIPLIPLDPIGIDSALIKKPDQRRAMQNRRIINFAWPFPNSIHHSLLPIQPL